MFGPDGPGGVDDMKAKWAAHGRAAQQREEDWLLCQKLKSREDEAPTAKAGSGSSRPCEPVSCGYPHRFIVALSFPGERREYVRQVDEFLCKQLSPDKIFYDDRFKSELARPNLDTYLQDIYINHSQLIVVFICRDYAQKEWCGLEWRAVRDIIKRKQGDRVMPFRFDDTDIPGISSIDGYIDARKHKPEQAAKLIMQRIQSMAHSRPNAKKQAAHSARTSGRKSRNQRKKKHRRKAED